MSQILPYKTIFKASEGDPEAVAAVLSHYAGYIRSCAKMDGQINTDTTTLKYLRTEASVTMSSRRYPASSQSFSRNAFILNAR